MSFLTLSTQCRVWNGKINLSFLLWEFTPFSSFCDGENRMSLNYCTNKSFSAESWNLKFKFKAFTYHECCWECWMLWLWISPSKLSEESLNDVFKETLSLVRLLMYIPYPTLLQKRSILDVWQGSEYASATLNLWNWSVFKFTDLKFLNNLESFKFNKDY